MYFHTETELHIYQRQDLIGSYLIKMLLTYLKTRLLSSPRSNFNKIEDRFSWRSGL